MSRDSGDRSGSGSGSGSAALKGCILLVFLGAVVAIMGFAAFTLLVRATPADRAPAVAVAPDADPQGANAKVPPDGGGPALTRIRSRGVLLIGMDTGEPPFTGTPPMYSPSDSGAPDGFDSALARKIAERVGVADIKVVHAKYSGLEALLLDATPKVDLVASGYVPTDTEGIAWSKPYLEFGLALVVPSKSKVKTTQDLYGKKIGIFDDDAVAEEVGKLVKGYTGLVRLEDGYWDQLVDGKFDGFLYDYPYAAAEIRGWYQQNPSRKGSLRIAQYNLTDSTYAVGVREGDADLLAAVNAAIAEWRASPAYGQAIKTWLRGGEAVDAPKGEGRVVVVQAGDTLSLIAQRELGSADRWPEVWDKNSSRFPNPHLVDVGDEVVLP